MLNAEIGNAYSPFGVGNFLSSSDQSCGVGVHCRHSCMQEPFAGLIPKSNFLMKNVKQEMDRVPFLECWFDLTLDF